jgi:hypothetical protein
MSSRATAVVEEDSVEDALATGIELRALEHPRVVHRRRALGARGGSGDGGAAGGTSGGPDEPSAATNLLAARYESAACRLAACCP